MEVTRKALLSIAMTLLVWPRPCNAQIAFGPIIAQQGTKVGTPITLETGPDDGFIACAEAVLADDYRNSNTTEAITNLSKKTNRNEIAFITGHGLPGLICTGNGMSCTGDVKLNLGLANESSWQSLAQTLRGRFSEITLLGCNVGTDQTGADFVSAVAQITQMPVRAPNSFVWCGNGKILFDQGGNWLTARPGVKLQPVEPNILTVQMKEGSAYKLKVNGAFVDIPESQISVANFQSQTLGGGQEFRSFVAGNSLQLMRQINFDAPFEINAVPAAIVTARFDLIVTRGDSRMTKHFAVLNDRIVGDSDSKGVYYRTSHEFSQRLSLMRR